MFNKRKYYEEKPDAECQEWEEVCGEYNSDTDNDPAAECVYINVDDEKAETEYVVYRPDAESMYYTDPQSIEVDGGAIELMDFPALRMALGIDRSIGDHETEAAEIESELTESGGELSDLILRYAGMEDETDSSEHCAAPQEELPSLFCFSPEDEKEELQVEVIDEDDRSEFTMESELALQREISGELFDYIDDINSSARELIRSREQSYLQRSEGRAYDPYNLNFNNRYDDTEEVLSSTPEISMEPKYSLGE